MNSCGIDEVRYLHYAAARLGATPVLLDIGSNEGDYTELFLERFPKGLAYCFEPIAEIYEKLVARWKDDSRVTTHNFGLHKEQVLGSDFYFVKNSTGMSSIHYRPRYYPKFDVEKITVYLEKFDDIYMNFPPVDFMKIDTEGNELFVLQGMTEFFKKNKPKFIQFEVGECYEDSHTTFKEVVEFLEERGYKIFNQNWQIVNSANVWENYDCQNYLAELIV
jgi:FkbM family methyltransferase